MKKKYKAISDINLTENNKEKNKTLDDTGNKINYQTLEQDDSKNINTEVIDINNEIQNQINITNNKSLKKKILFSCITLGFIMLIIFSLFQRKYKIDLNLNPEKIHIKIPPYSDPNLIKNYPVDEKTGTKCLDGSQFGIYYSPGRNSGENKLVINFEGGGWCMDRDENKVVNEKCYERIFNYYGSSKTWKDEYVYEYNFNGGDPKKNPQFYNWHKVEIPYCDGTGNQGFKKDPVKFDTENLFFKGYINTLEGLKFAFQHVDLDKLETVVISGCSSAGWAAFQWMQFIEDYLTEINPKINVMGIINAGFFFEYENIVTKDYDFTLKFKNLYKFANKEIPIVNKDCERDYKDKPYMCFFPQVIINYIKSPLLMYQSQYDSWQIWDVLGEKCVNDYRSLKHCNESQKKNIIKLKDYTKLQLKNAVEKKKISQFLVRLV